MLAALEPPAPRPNMNSTISEPSRNTASATTASSAEGGRAPLPTLPPTDFICAASSRPWCDIQIACQASISTAASSTPALKISCPTPSIALAMRSADSATSSAPSTPAATPLATQRPRPSSPRVAASTMVTTSAASRTSRNTSSAAASMARASRDYSATTTPCAVSMWNSPKYG